MTQRRNRRSGVEDRWRKRDGTPSASDGKGKRWRARYVNDEGREYARGFTRKVDAQKWLDEQTAALVGGTYIDPKKGVVTVRSFAEAWSADQIWEATTRSNFQASMKTVSFQDMALSELQVRHVQAWVKTMVDDGYATATIRSRFNHLRTVLRAARAQKYMADDVTSGVTLPRQARNADHMRIPTPGEVGRLMAVVDPDYRAFIALCAFAGLRRGEAAALQVADIRFLEREIEVRRQVQSMGGVEVRAPKYGSSRTVHAPKQLIDIVAQHVRLFCPGDDPARWLWPARHGDGPSPTGGDYKWVQARKAAGVDCRLHDLRHFYASGLIAAGCDVVTVQKAMGHRSASITLDTYSHLWPDASERTRKAAEAMWDSTADALRTEKPKTAVELA
ncbi:tyrosine-type recombinase/integrase [Gordonia sp. (in: high G+C Gram-positive bacteria)]|uniref:tyrosine-type recombinase/integrase n=1 Tax=Gordonia sp. (in: high G+C Gram-positive bacteria) TaxID=84139 RepID=UPI003C776789